MKKCTSTSVNPHNDLVILSRAKQTKHSGSIPCVCQKEEGHANGKEETDPAAWCECHCGYRWRKFNTVK